ITIPPNTIILPGQFFLIAGQSTIPLDCSADPLTVPANLNWNDCNNCVSAPIPTTGDGFMTDGGMGSEQLVLLDPNLGVVDAIVRDAVEPSVLITSSGTSCTPQTFDLDDMNIRYERVGESQGRANSFARKVNGGCGWLKDTQESPGASNNTSGNDPQFDASITVVQPTDCTEKGMVAVHILNADYSMVFPMKYLLGKDIDSNNVYDHLDYYTGGTDYVPSNIEIGDLSAGLYKVVVETQDGCDLQELTFNILNCISVPLKPGVRPEFSIRSPEEWLEIKSITSGQLSLKIQRKTGSKDQIRIIDLAGRILYRQHHQLSRGTTDLQIPVSLMQSNNYVIQWIDGKSGLCRNLKFSRYK
ncbi:MAG: hypothetical protein ACXWV5_06230, partial [Flavitalea sp.]